MQSVLRITQRRDTMNYLVSKRIPNAEAFLEHCERITMKSKSVVFRQGELSQDFYLILEGSVSVIVDDVEDPEQEMVVSYLNPGEFFGEMGAVWGRNPHR